MQFVFRPIYPLSTPVPEGRLNLPEPAADLKVAMDDLWRSLADRGPSTRRDPVVPDTEHFYENIAQLHAALRTGCPTFLAVDDFTPVPLGHGASFDPESPFVVIGYLQKPTPSSALDHLDKSGAADPLLSEPGCRWPVPENSLAAEVYWEIGAVRDLMRRFCEVSFIPDEDAGELKDDGIVAVMKRHLIATGRRSFFLKGTRPKSGIYRVELPDTLDPSDPDLSSRIVSQCLKSMEYEYARMAGYRQSLLVQPEVSFMREYRVLVVGGEAVAGAGVTSWATPLHAASGMGQGAFSTIISEFPESSALVPDGAHYVHKQVLPFSREAIRRISDERPDLQHYTLDVGVMSDPLDGTSKMAVVELNRMLNIGLYGLAYDKFLAAITHYAANTATTPMFKT